MLLYDLRNHDHVVALRGRVAQRGGNGEPGLSDIGSPNVVHRESVGSRLDDGNIDPR